MLRLRTHVLAVLLLCPFVATAQAAPFSYATHQLQLTDLGAGVNPTAINNVGQVVGQAANSQAFLWASGTTTPLGTLGGTQSYANDINDDGKAVGWSHDAGGQMRAFSWNVVDGMVNIGAEFTLATAAEAISNNNEIAGWIYNGVGNGYKSARWTEIVPEGEALFAVTGHKALGINDAGNIVGITLQTDGSPDAGFYWINSGDSSSFSGGLDFNYFPYAGINNQNNTAGFQSGSAGYLQIGDPLVSPIGKLQVDDDSSVALGINDLGLIVGESGDKGFLYDIATTDLFDLNLFPRLTLGFGQVLRLHDINNDGTFVGVALVDGVEHGIVGTLVVPEPSSVVLLAVGLGFLLLLATNPTRQRGCFVRLARRLAALPSLARRVSVLMLAVGCLVATAQAAPYSYATHQLQLTDLGSGVNPTAINNVGQVVGQAANSQAFLWTSGTTTPLGTLGGTQSYANDINDDGKAVGWSHDAGGQMRAFRWDSVNGIVNIGAAFTTETAAEAINTNGDIAGWRYNGTNYRSMHWTEDILPDGEVMFQNTNHKALGVNDQGNIVGITLNTDSSPGEGYYWINSGDTSSFSGGLGLDYFPYAGINNQDMTAGFQSGEAGYLPLGGSIVGPIGRIHGDDFSIALGINDLGLIVGESGAKGIVYDIADDALLDLNLFPRFTLGFGQVLRLHDINNDGTFVGVALVDGVEHGFVGTLVVPEPSSVALLAAGFAALLFSVTNPKAIYRRRIL